MSDITVVVGLGNPGPTYAGNRHNIGHMVVDELARRTRVRFAAHKSRAAVAAARLGILPGAIPGPRVILAKPTTYMNTSGGPVKALLDYYDLTPDELVVVHDELDVPFDEIRLKKGGGEGGHNGLKSISKSLGTPDYQRVRVGIGRPPGRMDAADYVLKDFRNSERLDLPIFIADAADAVETLIKDGLAVAQQRFHSPR